MWYFYLLRYYSLNTEYFLWGSQWVNIHGNRMTWGLFHILLNLDSLITGCNAAHQRQILWYGYCSKSLHLLPEVRLPPSYHRAILHKCIIISVLLHHNGVVWNCIVISKTETCFFPSATGILIQTQHFLLKNTWTFDFFSDFMYL